MKLMGFGHRVYKNYDPRAKLVKESADEVLAGLGVNDPLLDLAKELEQIALEDDYFKERRLYPNVDFYTGVIYKAMGFPTRMFTVLFAIGRLPGWMAHWREMSPTRRPRSAARSSCTWASPRAGIPRPEPLGGARLSALRGLARSAARRAQPAGFSWSVSVAASCTAVVVNGHARVSPRCHSGAWSA